MARRGLKLPATDTEPARPLLSFREYVSKVRPRFRWFRHCEVLADVLQRVADGKIKRLMIFMPPRHGKSEEVSRIFSAYWLYRFPHQWVGLNSYGADLAHDLSGAAQENFLAGGGRLKGASGAVKHWQTAEGGGLWAAGVGGPITGKGWHLGIIDDPIKNAQEAGSPTIQSTHREWYRSTFYTREEPDGRGDPDGAIILIQCMTGDTPVLLADGTEKPLRAVLVGDAVATYDRGRLSASKVLNWKSQGSDYIFTIRMSSGITVRANNRHPFLVERGGNTEWVRLKNLRVGDRVLRAIGGSGAALPVRTTDATSQPGVWAIACRITARPDGRTVTGHRRPIPSPEGRRTSGTDTASESRNTIPSSNPRAGSARSAENPRPPTCGRIGAASSASTTTTRRGRPAACSATTAISRSGTGRRKRRCSGPLDTFEITLDRIVEIVESGREEVFDIQVEGTENFVANGLVSHNTRWHEADLAGWLLSEEGSDDDEPERWHVVHLPAIAEDSPPAYPATCTVEPDWRQPGEALCPERRPLAKLLKIARRIGAYFFASIFQQSPRPREGGMFHSDWFPVVGAAPRQAERVRWWDMASTQDGGDWTAGCLVARTYDGMFYVEDVVRGRWSAGERNRMILQTAQLDRARYGNTVKIGGEQEPGSSGVDAAADFVKLLAGYPVATERASGSKEVRAQPAASQAEAGNILVVADTPERPWVRAFLDELGGFPTGKHDDQVDAFSAAFNDLALRPDSGSHVVGPPRAEATIQLY